jgi:poly [ADP-ribose] polymerase
MGVGKTFPDPSKMLVLPDGVEVPNGPLMTDRSIVSELLYNEFIVYDPEQVKMRYVVKVRFDYLTK